MLELNFLQQDNESLVNPPAKFSLTHLKNGNFGLSSLSDYHRLTTVLSSWQKTHCRTENLEAKYNIFLELNKKVCIDKIENDDFYGGKPSESLSENFVGSFVAETKIHENMNLLSVSLKEFLFFRF